jgi:predicted CXXCH cytochrome family protein
MECQTLESYDENHNPILKPKLKFETLDLAIKHAKKVNSLDHIIHKVVAYKCKQCHKYHVGRNGKELTEKERNKFKKAKQNRFI